MLFSVAIIVISSLSKSLCTLILSVHSFVERLCSHLLYIIALESFYNECTDGIKVQRVYFFWVCLMYNVARWDRILHKVWFTEIRPCWPTWRYGIRILNWWITKLFIKEIEIEHVVKSTLYLKFELQNKI